MKTTLALLLLVALIIVALALVAGIIHVPADALDQVRQGGSVPQEGLFYLMQWFE